jgi:hypothetical protein
LRKTVQIEDGFVQFDDLTTQSLEKGLIVAVQIRGFY